MVGFVQGIQIESLAFCKIGRGDEEKRAGRVLFLHKFYAVITRNEDSFSVFRDFLTALPEFALIESGVEESLAVLLYASDWTSVHDYAGSVASIQIKCCKASA
jgi:hypothetical protein